MQQIDTEMNQHREDRIVITFKRAISFLIPAFGFIVLSVPSVSAQGIFQGWAANQQINAIQRGLSSGLITQSQATDLMNHANDLASREQRLLQNDGGVLTPNDSSKIMKNLQKEGQRLQDMISSNGYNGTTGNGTGATGITGLLGSLLGGKLQHGSIKLRLWWHIGLPPQWLCCNGLPINWLPIDWLPLQRLRCQRISGCFVPAN